MRNMKYWKSMKTWAALAVVPLVLAVAAAATLPTDAPKTDRSAAASYAKNLSQAFRDAAQDVQDSVVLIKADPVMPVQWNDRGRMPKGEAPENPFEGTPFGNIPELRRFFEDMPQMPQSPHGGRSGIGSGVIIDAGGVILTNNHVVEGRNDITVRLHDGREFKATGVQTDPNTDLAILRIEGAKDLKPARLGDSDLLEVGDWVLALGHPFGLEGTLTSGIVSAKGRGIGMPARATFIQTDAAINPGNSGGPLINLDGEVVGINTAISSSNGGNQGVGFAIPVNLAKWVSGELMKDGVVQRAQLGVMIQPMTHELAAQFGLKAPEGVAVSDVMDNTPAAKAGLKAGDVILEYGGQKVSTPRELQEIVERSEIGAKHEVKIWRDGKQQTLHAVPRESNDQPAQSGETRLERSNPSRLENLGLEVETLTPEIAEQLNVNADHGVVISDVLSGSPADRAGLESGMVIVEAGRSPVKSVADLKKAVEEAKDGSVLLLVRSEQGSRFVVLKASE
ncbi:MAG: Do family serine endopeptidase [Planctomycetaceae bacterium]|nr:Do family serine endopeptidase [Planctomycetaceae bacterium]